MQGKFKRCLITHLVADGQPKDLRVKVQRQTIFAMVWCLLNLRASSLGGYLYSRSNTILPEKSSGSCRRERDSIKAKETGLLQELAEVRGGLKKKVIGLH